MIQATENFYQYQIDRQNKVIIRCMNVLEELEQESPNSEIVQKLRKALYGPNPQESTQ